MPSVVTTNAATSGIIESETGERHIPSSVRPDGSQRKEIRIRPGYRPPEDVEVYKNRTAEAFRTRGSAGVPGARPIEPTIPPECSTSTNKNAKRREARKKAKETEPGTNTERQEAGAEVLSKAAKNDEGKDDALESGTSSIPSSLDTADKEKQMKKLRKKLREARDLQEKKLQGEVLLREQFEKVIRINELIKDLEKLGVDASGESTKD